MKLANFQDFWLFFYEVGKISRFSAISTKLAKFHDFLGIFFNVGQKFMIFVFFHDFGKIS